MTVLTPEPCEKPCCLLAAVFRSSYERALGRGEPARATEAIEDWAEHQIEAHGAEAPAVPSCPACQRLDLPAPDGVSAETWDFTGRVHRLAHRLAPPVIQPS
ncbi:hypothetical protein [Streptomyces sp. NPDC088915]|uniref:hypothetical protein n=1 Tax=Streptomyces sp. NPDC088915 TaxID=3365912 RepID=UPI0038163C06